MTGNPVADVAAGALQTIDPTGITQVANVAQEVGNFGVNAINEITGDVTKIISGGGIGDIATRGHIVEAEAGLKTLALAEGDNGPHVLMALSNLLNNQVWFDGTSLTPSAGDDSVTPQQREMAAQRMAVLNFLMTQINSTVYEAGDFVEKIGYNEGRINAEGNAVANGFLTTGAFAVVGGLLALTPIGIPALIVGGVVGLVGGGIQYFKTKHEGGLQQEENRERQFALTQASNVQLGSMNALLNAMYNLTPETVVQIAEATGMDVPSATKVIMDINLNITAFRIVDHYNDEAWLQQNLGTSLKRMSDMIQTQPGKKKLSDTALRILSTSESIEGAIGMLQGLGINVSGYSKEELRQIMIAYKFDKLKDKLNYTDLVAFMGGVDTSSNDPTVFMDRLYTAIETQYNNVNPLGRIFDGIGGWFNQILSNLFGFNKPEEAAPAANNPAVPNPTPPAPAAPTITPTAADVATSTALPTIPGVTNPVNVTPDFVTPTPNNAARPTPTPTPTMTPLPAAG